MSMNLRARLSEMGQNGEKYSINMQKKQQNEEIPSPDINVHEEEISPSKLDSF